MKVILDKRPFYREIFGWEGLGNWEPIDAPTIEEFLKQIQRDMLKNTDWRKFQILDFYFDENNKCVATEYRKDDLYYVYPNSFFCREY